MNKSFCCFFQKEVLFFFEKKNQKTFVQWITLSIQTVRARGKYAFFGSGYKRMLASWCLPAFGSE